MRKLLLALTTLCASAGAVSPSGAQAEQGVDALYPEGPLMVGDAVLFAEMQRDRVIRWDADGTDSFFEERGCGPTAIAPHGDGYAVLCHLNDQVVTLSSTGERKAVLRHDTAGSRFDNPNDAGADDAGGVYFSASGIFSRTARPTGALLYLDKEGQIHRLASDLAYTNGIVFDAARARVLVSEHLGGRILSFPVTAPGQVGKPSVFADVNTLNVIDPEGFPPQGPDGLEIDRAGNIYAAVYGTGTLLIFSPDGNLLDRLSWSQDLITSVTLTDEERTLILTGSTNAPGHIFHGRVERLPNPLAE